MAVIRITQLLRPSGKRAEIPVDIKDELKEAANKLEIKLIHIGLQRVMIYAHRKGESAEDELTEMADNGPGENTPQMALERLIRRFEKNHKNKLLED